MPVDQPLASIEAQAIEQALHALANPDIAAHSQRFFKTGPGQYGEGDLFLGIRLPVLRSLLPRFRQVSLDGVCQVLQSCWHEQRLFALLLMVTRTAKSGRHQRAEILTRYLALTNWINNWDLVDCSAPGIVGVTLADHDRGLLRDLARSASLWERRIAIIATLHFIRNNDFSDCLDIAGLLVNDRHDLIHKAVGWMLREVGKRNQSVAEEFLRHHCQTMPRTMLRYAIERYPEHLRMSYLRGEAGNQR